MIHRGLTGVRQGTGHLSTPPDEVDRQTLLSSITDGTALHCTALLHSANPQDSTPWQHDHRRASLQCARSLTKSPVAYRLPQAPTRALSRKQRRSILQTRNSIALSPPEQARWLNDSSSCAHRVPRPAWESHAVIHNQSWLAIPTETMSKPIPSQDAPRDSEVPDAGLRSLDHCMRTRLTNCAFENEKASFANMPVVQIKEPCRNGGTRCARRRCL